MDWNLVVATASLSFAPITVWLTKKQLQQSRLKDSAYSLRIRLKQAEHLSLHVIHTGINPLHRVEVWATFGEKQTLLREALKFEPGDELTAPGLSRRPDAVSVFWFAPHPKEPGIRAQAVRVLYQDGHENQAEYWKYYWWSHIRLDFRSHLNRRWSLKLEEKKTHFPMGRWSRLPRRVDRPGDRPGWPNQRR